MPVVLAPHYLRCLSRHQSTSQTASWSAYLRLQSSCRCTYNGHTMVRCPPPKKKLPFPLDGCWHRPNNGYFGPQPHNLNDTSIGSAVFVGLTVCPPDRRTSVLWCGLIMLFLCLCCWRHYVIGLSVCLCMCPYIHRACLLTYVRAETKAVSDWLNKQATLNTG